MTTIEAGAQDQGLRGVKPWKWPILAASPLVVVLSYFGMPAYVEFADEIGYMLRVTARLAFVLLMLAYLARPLQRGFGMGRTLVLHRRYLGLAMAFAHTVHFGYVVLLVQNSAEPLGWITIVGGGLAFVLMWLMAATSNDQSVALLGKNWRRLHTFGLHYLWLIFMQSFAGRIGPEDEDYLYAGLTIVGLLGLLLRVWVYLSGRLRRTT